MSDVSLCWKSLLYVLFMLVHARAKCSELSSGKIGKKVLSYYGHMCEVLRPIVWKTENKADANFF